MMQDLKIEVRDRIESFKKEKALLDKVKSLQNIEILVGIPQENNDREGSPLGNAALLFLHTKGSPIKGLPARPLIEPALFAPDNADRIAADLKEITLAVLNGDYDRAEKLMGVTGQDAVNMITDWFDDPRNGWEPNKDATVKAKLRRTSKSPKEREKLFKKYLRGAANINTVLVDTDEMRKAITYVVGGKK